MSDIENTAAGTDEKLTQEEIIKTLGFLVTAEYKFVKLYLQLAASIEDEYSTQMLKEMADEDKQHAGVLLELIQDIAPESDLIKKADTTE